MSTFTIPDCIKIMMLSSIGMQVADHVALAILPALIGFLVAAIFFCSLAEVA